MTSLRKVVFHLMDIGECNDQRVYDGFGKEPNWYTVETYKTAWKKEKYLQEQAIKDETLDN